MDAEKAHHFVTSQLSLWSKFGLSRAAINLFWKLEHEDLQCSAMGLSFTNPIGLAAGFDKNGQYLQGMAAMGFGFVEVGTVTPVPQVGNEKPRLFRLPQDEALLNRMGFNNGGLDALIEKLKDRPKGLIVGGNIGKNKSTPNEKAVDDYTKCFDGLHPYVDYFVVNVSSPNTPGLRSLQDRKPLTKILEALRIRNEALPQPIPILLKIAPDLSDSQIEEIVEIVKEQGLAGIVACNTTISRKDLKTPPTEVEALGAGGLSGLPARKRATEVIRLIRQFAGEDLVIIGVGGIGSSQDAVDKIAAGANLIQIYTGLVYEGPRLIRRIKDQLLKSN